MADQYKDAPEHLRPQGKHLRNSPVQSRILKWAALSCIAVLGIAIALGGFALLRLRSNVQTAELNIGELSADLANGPLDILVIGSDTRQGSNSSYGTAEDVAAGARSDVMMLVQVSEDRSNINVISFPRDLIVDIPRCKDPETGEVFPASADTQINESLGRGGPGCTVSTISNITGVAVDHFMLVDFNAVKALSSAVGGVQVCVNQEIDDPYSGLKLPAGVSSVEGEQALAFLRSRHGFGDGSDTARIQAQQSFLASLLRKVQAEGTLSNPAKLYSIAEAVTQNATIDKELTKLSNLVSLGTVFAQADLSKVVFATVPHEPYIYDANKLQLSAEADAFFEKLQNDQSLVEEPAPAPSGEAEATGPETEVATEEPHLEYSLPVLLSNGSGVDGRASDLVQVLEQAGFIQVTAEEGGTVYTESLLYYPYGYEAEAQAIANIFGIKQLIPSDQVFGISLLIGSDLAESDTVQSENDTAITGGASGQTAAQETCQQAFFSY
ncbi:LCP family protein [Rothia nasimurium]|uniref:LCP family protein n=1 Tax=Rothia nasimurium TaxID=85336 RepID=UPI001F1E6273|nr:LCP family protein [Rothia nasimurium]